MLVDSKKMLQIAREQKFAIPATNFIDLDSARIFVKVAEERRLPLILPFAQLHQTIIPLEEAALVGKYLAEKAQVPIALHLDHGEDIEFIERAIRLGFKSVMIDASMKDFEENIAITREVVQLAHSLDVSVEAELGHVGSGDHYENYEQTDSVYTEVTDVLNFIDQTNIDSLAISIGTAHGAYKGIPKINFQRLAEINQVSKVPLVLHGGSSSGDDNLEKCATGGISKINIFTDFLVGAQKQIKESQIKDYLQIKEEANKGMEKVLNHYFDLFHTQSI